MSYSLIHCVFFFVWRFMCLLQLCNLCFPLWTDDSHILGEIITVEVTLTHTHHTRCVVSDAHGCNVVYLFFFLSLRSLKTAFGCDIWDKSIYECVRIRIWKHQKFKKYFCSVSPYSAIFMLVWFKRFSKCCFCFFFLFMTCSRLSSLKNTQLHLISQIHTERDRAN